MINTFVQSFTNSKIAINILFKTYAQYRHKKHKYFPMVEYELFFFFNKIIQILQTNATLNLHNYNIGI